MITRASSKTDSSPLVLWKRLVRPMLCGIALVLLPASLGRLGLAAHGDRLLWNGSPSVPIGLYSTQPLSAAPVTTRSYVCLLGAGAHSPAVLREAIASGRVSPRWKSEPLLKLVAAVEGDVLTYDGEQVLVNGATLPHSKARALDGDGQPLPTPKYPLVIHHDEVWLASVHDDGFDSRYYGAVSLQALSCTAAPLWIP